jgi:hypothetical protein
VAILEQYAIIYIPELFSAIPARQKLVEDLLQRRSLDKLARNLVLSLRDGLHIVLNVYILLNIF